MDMGQKINNLRLEKGMTLEELGNKVGVGKSTVRKWENGMIANMKRDKILKVAEALSTTPAYLMGWDDASHLEDSEINPIKGKMIDQKTLKIAKSLANDPELIELIELLQKVDKGERMLVNQLLQKIVDTKK